MRSPPVIGTTVSLALLTMLDREFPRVVVALVLARNAQRNRSLALSGSATNRGDKPGDHWRRVLPVPAMRGMAAADRGLLDESMRRPAASTVADARLTLTRSS